MRYTATVDIYRFGWVEIRGGGGVIVVCTVQVVGDVLGGFAYARIRGVS